MPQATETDVIDPHRRIQQRIAWLTLAAVPLVLFIRHFKPAGKAPADY